MKKSYLIQEISKNPNGSIYYNYMGSSEFEFGALPQAITEMKKSSLTFGIVLLKKKPILFIGKTGDEKDIKQAISDLSLNKIHLKELICFSTKIHSGVKNNTHGWFDIENLFLFFDDYTVFSGYAEILNLKVPTLLQLKKCCSV